MAQDLLAVVRQQWQAGLCWANSIEVGLSGGLDSVVLLHILAQLRESLGWQLSAVHVHHGLQSPADEWAQWCATWCAEQAIPLRVERVQVAAQGWGVEAAARQARYAAFGNTSAKVLALAHHADDQVETFMLAALRGGGLRALSAMPVWRALNEQVQLWRPLLSISRADLLAYAQHHKLAYVEDPSNEDASYLRNWLRHQGLPAWQARLPALKQHILSSVALLQDELAVLDECVAADAANIQVQGYFDCQIWRTLGSARRRQQLLHYVKQYALGQPTQAAIADFERVLWALGMQSAQWRLPKGEIWAYQNRLFALPAHWQQGVLPPMETGCLQTLFTRAGWQLQSAAYGLSEQVLAQYGAIRCVQKEDVLPLAKGHKSVLKLLQEYRVPPFIRQQWRVVVDNHNRCLAVPNIGVDKRLAVKGGYVPYWQGLDAFILNKN